MKLKMTYLLLIILTTSFVMKNGTCEIENNSTFMLQSNSSEVNFCFKRKRYTIENEDSNKENLEVRLDTTTFYPDNSATIRTFSVINYSDSIYEISSQDNLIPFIQEALDSNGTWKPIEFWLNSSCGNSYHKIELKQNEAISFPIRNYTGNFSTLLRIKMRINGTIHYSEPFKGSINHTQFDYWYCHKPKQPSRKEWNKLKDKEPYTNMKRKQVSIGAERPSQPDFIK